MTFRELTVPGAWEITPNQLGDPRGVFLEVLQGGPLSAAIGHRFNLQQANCSVSAAGVLRGVHFADLPPGQAKYVTCAKGAVLDVVVDIRVGSPTFGQWDSVLLDDADRRSVYVSEGLGHSFVSLEDDSTVLYLCSAPYAPGREHAIDPMDPDLAIAWPRVGRDGSRLELILSDKDAHAPSLAQTQAAGLLPTVRTVEEYVATLREA